MFKLKFPFYEKGKTDYVLMINFFVLILVGLIILYSASYFQACQRFNDCFFYLKRQLVRGLFPGLILFFIFYFFNYQKLKKLSPFLFFLTVVLLGIVFIPGIGVAKEGARRWIDIGFIFQPSEPAKLAFIIYLAAWLANSKEKIKSFGNGLLPFVIFLAIISLLIILQPDLGTLIVFILTALVMYFLAGAPLLHLLILVGATAPLIFFLVKIAPYRLARVMAFLHPESDPLGIGYHINQAILAISSGGIFGRGIGYSVQKIHYLPEVISDSIFAVMAEELGFILISVVVILYLVLTYRIFLLAGQTKNLFGKFLAGGIGFWFIFQAVVNMGAMLGILPLTGMPLPLIGYGGSDFVIFCAAFGILMNISRQVSEKN